MENTDLNIQFKQAQKFKDNGQTDQAIEQFQKIVKQAVSQNQPELQAQAVHMLGVCFLMERKHQQALQTLQQASQLYQQLDFPLELGSVYRDIGLTFFYRKQYDQSRQWLDRSAQVLGKIQAKAELGLTLAKSALLFKEMHQWDKSSLLFKQSLTLIREQGHWFYEATTMIDWSLLSYKKKDFHQSITKLWAAFGLIHQAKAEKIQQRRLAEIYGLLASSYFRLGNVNWAINLCNASLQYLQEMPKDVRDHIMKRSKIYKFIKRLYKQDVNLYRELIDQSPIPELRRIQVTK